MRLRIDHSQTTAAAKAGLSIATARRLEHDPRSPPVKPQRRTYRTRTDPLAGLWDQEILPLLQAAPGLRPVTLLIELARRHPGQIDASSRRTLERRIATWKAQHGPGQDVIFPQIQQPGRMGLSDFTDANELGVTIADVHLAHRLYHFALACSGFEHAEVVLGGESYPALAGGLDNALRLLGGVPREHRTDSLSAAFRNLALPDAEDLTRRYSALAAHYGMLPTRNNRGIARENGAIESRNGHIKRRLAQALLLRGSADFGDLNAYRAFVTGTIAQHNRRYAAAIEAERAVLQPLPAAPAMTWDDITVRVTTSSGFMCRGVFYTVPSRLIGHRLQLRVFDDRIQAFLGGDPLLTLPRGRRSKGAGAVHVVDYHHVIAALRAKPGALTHLAYRDALWPRTAFRRAFEALSEAQSERDTARTMVGLLALAHDRGVEAGLAGALDTELDAGRLPDLAEMMRRFMPRETAAPDVRVTIPSASVYDSLLTEDPDPPPHAETAKPEMAS